MDSDLYNGIFVRAARHGEFNLNIRDVYATIPKSSVVEPILGLEDTKTVWRWRFLKFGDKIKVEISRKHPKGKRMYLNEKSEWVERNISSDFDKYVVKQFYYYCSESNSQT